MRYPRLVLCFIVVAMAMQQPVHAQRLLDRLGEVLRPREDRADAEPLPSPNLRAPAQPQATAGRPTLGVRVDPVTPDNIRQYDLVVRQGAVVSEVVRGSAADRAQLAAGTVIVAVDGRRVDDPRDLSAAIARARVDGETEFMYYQGPRLVRKRIQLDVINDGQVAGQPPRESPRREALRPVQPSLEDQLGEGGRRPVLGRLGRVIDGLVAPAAGEQPAPRPPRPADADLDEVSRLRERVNFLEEEVDDLRRRLRRLEAAVGAEPLPAPRLRPPVVNER